MSSFRICRCGCGQRMPTKTRMPKSGRSIERLIKCGYCGDTVDQNSTNYRSGKTYHDRCVIPYKNFIFSLNSRNHVGLKSETVRAFRDYILIQMIMKKDVRMLHFHWKIVLRQKATPLVLKQTVLENQLILA